VNWPSVKARQVLAALFRLGWVEIRPSGSHKTLARAGWPNDVWAFSDGDELGRKMLSRIAKHTGLTQEDL